MTQLRHYDDLDTARFVTFSCYQRLPLFRQGKTKNLFISYLQTFRQHTGIKILGYVIMPEHVHLVLYPPTGCSLGREIGKLKGRSATELLATLNDAPLRLLRDGAITKHRAFWQRRCYDHNCRSRQTTIEKIEYCHNNPVKRGLVSNPSDWCWSSYRWYQGYNNAILEIDEFD